MEPLAKKRKYRDALAASQAMVEILREELYESPAVIAELAICASSICLMKQEHRGAQRRPINVQRRLLQRPLDCQLPLGFILLPSHQQPVSWTGWIPFMACQQSKL